MTQKSFLVSLSEEELNSLAIYARITGVTRTKLIKRIIDEWMTKEIKDGNANLVKSINISKK